VYHLVNNLANEHKFLGWSYEYILHDRKLKVKGYVPSHAFIVKVNLGVVACVVNGRAWDINKKHPIL
jgi:hypothetical protein